MSWNDLAQLEWAHPWGILLALQPVLMFLLLKLRRKQIFRYADEHLRAWAMRSNAELKQSRWRDFLQLFAWILLACALASPRFPLLEDQFQKQAKQEHQLDIMVLLDVSPSMLARDVSPQRLQRAKLELLDLLPRLHGERLGLIAFSGTAGLIMPMNRDASLFSYYLNIAEPGLFDSPGTALANAIELALRSMPKEKHLHRAILLLTDAETSALSGPAGAAVWASADKLKSADIPLYILGVGTEQGSTVTLPDGNTLASEGEDVISRMDKPGFRELANSTHGKFVEVADGDGDWQALYDHGLLSVPGGKPAFEDVESWQEIYGIFLVPALLIFALLYLPIEKSIFKHVQLFLLAGFIVLMGIPEGNAAEADAYTAYLAQNHTRAQTLYGELAGFSARMGEGAAAYRRKDYQFAIKQFSKALLEAKETAQRENALFNLGNSYFLAGNYLAAADAFLGVMRYSPDKPQAPILQNARANLALAAGKLAEINKAGKKSNGILGRRGREIGGAMGEDASDQPLAMDTSDDKKEKLPGVVNELTDVEKARLLTRGKAIITSLSKEIDRDSAYRVALKKLELTGDAPVSLHRSLIKIEAARDYVPQPEMTPW